MHPGTAFCPVEPGDSFEQWHQVTCRDFSRTECVRVPAAGFSARIALQPFGPLTVSSIASSTRADDPVVVVRSSDDIRKDPRDYFMLWLAVGGETVFSQADRSVALAPGDLVLHDQAQPFSLRFSRESRAIMVSMPRALVRDRLYQPERRTAYRLPGRSHLCGLAGSMVRQLARPQQPADAGSADALAGPVLDVFAAMVDGVTAPSAGTSQEAERLMAVQRYMLDRLEDSGLGLIEIAAANAMSVRTLSRLFAAQGTTPIRWLWDQRLEAARRAIASGRCRNVTEAAFSVGFSDVSSFSKAFKAKYGIAPHRLKQS